jgi:hypothetical protein
VTKRRLRHAQFGSRARETALPRDRQKVENIVDVFTRHESSSKVEGLSPFYQPVDPGFFHGLHIVEHQQAPTSAV